MEREKSLISPGEISSFKRSPGRGVFSKYYGDFFVTSVSDVLKPGLRGLLKERAKEGGPFHDENWVNAVLDDDEMHFGMAFCRDVGVGYWMAEEEYGSSLEGRYLFVHPDFRGSDIGTALKLHQIEYANWVGANWLWSEVVEENLASARVHEKIGILGDNMRGKHWSLVNTSLRGRVFADYDLKNVNRDTKTIPPRIGISLPLVKKQLLLEDISDEGFKLLD